MPCRCFLSYKLKDKGYATSKTHLTCQRSSCIVGNVGAKLIKRNLWNLKKDDISGYVASILIMSFFLTVHRESDSVIGCNSESVEYTL